MNTVWYSGPTEPGSRSTIQKPFHSIVPRLGLAGREPFMLAVLHGKPAVD